MKKLILSLLLLFCFAGTSSAIQFGADIDCPVPGEIGEIRVVFSSVTIPNPSKLGEDTGIGMSNLETKQGLFYTHPHTMYFKAKCEDDYKSHLAWTVQYTGTINVAASWVSPLVVNNDNKQIASFMVGALTAIAFSLAVAKGTRS